VLVVVPSSLVVVVIRSSVYGSSFARRFKMLVGVGSPEWSCHFAKRSASALPIEGLSRRPV